MFNCILACYTFIVSSLPIKRERKNLKTLIHAETHISVEGFGIPSPSTPHNHAGDCHHQQSEGTCPAANYELN